LIGRRGDDGVSGGGGRRRPTIEFLEDESEKEKEKEKMEPNMRAKNKCKKSRVCIIR
jgi:hypothetical protein